MQRHTRVYYNYFHFGADDFIPCERCHQRAVDVHHIQGRGKSKDVIENLMALCRDCHVYAHSGNHKRELQERHNLFLIDHDRD